MDVLRRLFNPPSSSFFLFGPRGTGKSLFLKTHFPKALYIDLLDPETFRTLAARPETLKEIILGHPNAVVIIIDEIQKLPILLDVVHHLITTKATYQFILTGSSTRKLKHAGVNLLASRALLTHMHPFMAYELGNTFNLKLSLTQGMIPLIHFSKDPRQALQTYATLYLKEEVQMEGLVRNIGHFSRFLETMSFSHGQVLNLSHIARECQIGRKAVEGYLSVLEDLLLGFQIPVFSKKAKRHLITHNKFYYFDTGVFEALRPKGILDTPDNLAGSALEGLVAQHLRAYLDYQSNDSHLFYWRTKSGVEIDFIIYGPKDFFAIEVTRSKTVSQRDINALLTFKEDYPQVSPVLLYGGSEQIVRQSIPCIPVELFLIRLSPLKSLSVLI